VHWLGPACVGGFGFGVQVVDHPPNNTPICVGAVSVSVVPIGYVATHTDPPDPVQPGPQWITFGVPVAEGAVTSQFVVFSPSL